MPLVECYAASRYPERPRALFWQGERIEVEEVERQWRTPRGFVFVVRAVGGCRFRLTYDEATDAAYQDTPDLAWRIQLL
ncbi:MAG TPA: hypothetical protein ENN19_02180 [Chloroflexi bacterium]|nr:hypothetical protein [Chloroflexota bacterium]